MADQDNKRTESDRRVSDRRKKQIPVELDRRKQPNRRSGVDRRNAR